MSKNETPILIQEHLSALLDDEAGAFEQRRVIDELKNDSKLSNKLSTYALIGETMRMGDSESSTLSLGTSFLDGIHEKIDLEDNFDEVFVDTGIEAKQVAQSTSEKSPSSWFRPVGGFALAASVGALAFMGLQNMGLLSNPSYQPSGIVDNSAPTAIVQANPVSNTSENTDNKVATIKSTNDEQYLDADLQARAYLKRYVDTHMQYATSTSFVPSVRAIAYTNNQ